MLAVKMAQLSNNMSFEGRPCRIIANSKLLINWIELAVAYKLMAYTADRKNTENRYFQTFDIYFDILIMKVKQLSNDIHLSKK